MKRENILISEDITTKRVSATKFTAPGDIPVFDSSIHFGKEGNDVTLQNCIIQDNALVKCSPEDTYDFETGALIALMKLCGVEKVKKAAKETFFDVAEDSVNEYEEEIKKLKKRINELEVYNNQLEDRVAAEQRGGYMFLKDMEKLQHEYDLCRNSENALKITTQLQNKSIEKLTKAIDGYKQDLYKVTKRCEELEFKESILNKQQEQLDKREEKMSVYFGGRGNGKQYKALVSLFKKLDQKKVDAAYKEAYNTTLPVWQKEALRQACNIVTDEKEKRNNKESLNWCTSQSSTRDYLDSLIEGSRAFTRKFDYEWYYKIPTKREQMWNDILACDCEHSKYVKVKKEDLETFAKECNEKKIFNIVGYEFHTQEYWFNKDGCIFQIFRKPAGFICAERLCYVFKGTVIDYLPPMRWDLFKKGRIAVKVTYNNRKEFYESCEKELGKKPSFIYTGDFTVSICKKDGNFEIFTMEDQKKTGRKIVNWEDVR